MSVNNTHLGIKHIFTNRSADQYIDIVPGAGETLRFPNSVVINGVTLPSDLSGYIPIGISSTTVEFNRTSTKDFTLTAPNINLNATTSISIAGDSDTDITFSGRTVYLGTPTVDFLNCNTIQNVPTPTSSTHAVNKTYSDTKDALLVPYTGASGLINLGAQEIKSTYVPTIGPDLINKTYLDTQTALLVPYTGASGLVNLGAQEIKTTYVPTIGPDLINKTYLDTQTALLVPYTGASGLVNLGSQEIKSTYVPSISADLTNKLYVDAQVGAGIPTYYSVESALATGTDNNMCIGIWYQPTISYANVWASTPTQIQEISWRDTSNVDAFQTIGDSNTITFARLTASGTYGEDRDNDASTYQEGNALHLFKISQPFPDTLIFRHVRGTNNPDPYYFYGLMGYGTEALIGNENTVTSPTTISTFPNFIASNRHYMYGNMAYLKFGSSGLKYFKTKKMKLPLNYLELMPLSLARGNYGAHVGIAFHTVKFYQESVLNGVVTSTQIPNSLNFAAQWIGNTSGSLNYSGTTITHSTGTGATAGNVLDDNDTTYAFQYTNVGANVGIGTTFPALGTMPDITSLVIYISNPLINPYFVDRIDIVTVDSIDETSVETYLAISEGNVLDSYRPTYTSGANSLVTKSVRPNIKIDSTVIEVPVSGNYQITVYIASNGTADKYMLVKKTPGDRYEFLTQNFGSNTTKVFSNLMLNAGDCVAVLNRIPESGKYVDFTNCIFTIKKSDQEIITTSYTQTFGTKNDLDVRDIQTDNLTVYTTSSLAGATTMSGSISATLSGTMTTTTNNYFNGLIQDIGSLKVSYPDQRDAMIYSIMANWTGFNHGTIWKSVCWSKYLSLFVACGTNIISTSPSGASWTSRTCPALNYQYINADGPTILACCSSGTKIVGSKDGTTWTTSTTNFVNASYTDLKYIPETQCYVMIENGTSTSQTCIGYNGYDPIVGVWDTRGNGGSANDNKWKCVAWSPSLGIGVGLDDGTNSVFHAYSTPSYDNLSFTTRTAPASNWSRVVWSPELAIFSAVASSGTVRCIYSTNGTSWSNGTITSNTWKDLIWQQDARLFIAVGTDGVMASSKDGITYTSQTNASFGANTDFTGIAFGNGRLALVSETASQTNEIWQSTIPGSTTLTYSTDIDIGVQGHSDVNIYGESVDIQGDNVNVGIYSGNLNLGVIQKLKSNNVFYAANLANLVYQNAQGLVYNGNIYSNVLYYDGNTTAGYNTTATLATTAGKFYITIPGFYTFQGNILSTTAGGTGLDCTLLRNGVQVSGMFSDQTSSTGSGRANNCYFFYSPAISGDNFQIKYTGPNSAIANTLSDYQRLVIRLSDIVLI